MKYIKYIIYYVAGLLILSAAPTLIFGAVFTVGIYYFLFMLYRGFTSGSNGSSKGGGSRADKTNSSKTNNEKPREEYKPIPQNRTPRYSGYRRYDEADYGGYYDDWQDDMPPEEGDGFRGTGGPFL